MKTKLISLVSFFALICSTAFANADETKLELAPTSPQLVAANNSNNSQMRNTWTPYFYCMSALQPRTQTFVQVNIGTGFLYFSGVKGNLQPGGIANQSYLKTATPLQRRLNYNRTPLYEAIFGYQFNNWFKAAISFQAQGDITVSSDWQITQRTAAGTLLSRKKFMADVTLYGLTAKAYFNFPYALVWKMMSFNPYLAFAVGPGWQTWKRVMTLEDVGTGVPTQAPTNISSTVWLHQKISANAVFMTDIGVSSTWLVKQTSFTLVKGMKFNIWGQARSMGKESQQQFVAEREYLSNPVRIKTVYQFAPYLGLQWNF